MTDLALLAGILAALVVVLTVVWTTVRMGGDGSPSRAADPAQSGTDGTTAGEARRRPVAAVVVNPTKFDDLPEVQSRLDGIASEHGWELRWWETTEEDNGTGQTVEALDAEVDLVCALGGDGTVRAVAAALRDTGVPMGLLPGGTGNLLARNLDLPFDSLEDSLVVALTGEDTRIDVGCLSVAPADTQDEPKDYYFLVMAGLGFDASVMAEAPEALKSHIGWAAYVVSGLTQLNGPRFATTVRFDDEPPVQRRVRSIIIGNVGRLQGGVELLPDASVDDGTLDAVLLAPKGVVGWAGVAVRILTKTRRGHHRVEHFQCRHMQVDLAGGHEEEVQLDGDPIGPARSLAVSVLPKSLVVRTARTGHEGDHHGANTAENVLPARTVAPPTTDPATGATAAASMR